MEKKTKAKAKSLTKKAINNSARVIEIFELLMDLSGKLALVLTASEDDLIEELQVIAVNCQQFSMQPRLFLPFLNELSLQAYPTAVALMCNFIGDDHERNHEIAVRVRNRERDSLFSYRNGDRTSSAYDVAANFVFAVFFHGIYNSLAMTLGSTSSSSSTTSPDANRTLMELRREFYTAIVKALTTASTLLHDGGVDPASRVKLMKPHLGPVFDIASTLAEMDALRSTLEGLAVDMGAFLNRNSPAYKVAKKGVQGNDDKDKFEWAQHQYRNACTAYSVFNILHCEHLDDEEVAADFIFSAIFQMCCTRLYLKKNPVPESPSTSISIAPVPTRFYAKDACTLHVLIVDDNKYALEGMRKAFADFSLENVSFQITLVTTYAAALGLWTARFLSPAPPFNIAILDHFLSSALEGKQTRTGLDLACEMRKVEGENNIGATDKARFLFVTAADPSKTAEQRSKIEREKGANFLQPYNSFSGKPSVPEHIADLLVKAGVLYEKKPAVKKRISDSFDEASAASSSTPMEAS